MRFRCSLTPHVYQINNQSFPATAPVVLTTLSTSSNLAQLPYLSVFLCAPLCLRSSVITRFQRFSNNPRRLTCSHRHCKLKQQKQPWQWSRDAQHVARTMCSSPFSTLFLPSSQRISIGLSVLQFTIILCKVYYSNNLWFPSWLREQRQPHPSLHI